MTLTEQQKKQALAFMNDKWRRPRPCGSCGLSNWSVQDAIYEVREFTGGGLGLGGRLIPLLVVDCVNCGNTLFVNAIKAGVVDPQPPPGAAPMGNSNA